MKLKIIIAVIVLLLIAGNAILLRQNMSIRDNADALRVNMAQQGDSLSRVITLTKRDFKFLLKEKDNDIDSILNAEKIRPAKVRVVTVDKHHYHTEYDTVYVSDGTPSINNDSLLYYNWEASNKCLVISGNVLAKTEVKPIVSVLDADYNTEITHIGYWKKKWTGRRFLWVIKIKKKYIELHTSSTCGDNIVEHLEISDSE